MHNISMRLFRSYKKTSSGQRISKDAPEQNLFVLFLQRKGVTLTPKLVRFCLYISGYLLAKYFVII